jgi:hypothetical protein
VGRTLALGVSLFASHARESGLICESIAAAIGPAPLGAAEAEPVFYNIMNIEGGSTHEVVE